MANIHSVIYSQDTLFSLIDLQFAPYTNKNQRNNFKKQNIDKHDRLFSVAGDRLAKLLRTVYTNNEEIPKITVSIHQFICHGTIKYVLAYSDFESKITKFAIFLRH